MRVVWIHASKTLAEGEAGAGVGACGTLPRGAVVAVALFERARRYDAAAYAGDPHATGPLCYDIADAARLERPVPCRGQLGMFALDAAGLDACLADRGVAAALGRWMRDHPDALGEVAARGVRALSVRQPYAEWIASGIKRVENRSRSVGDVTSVPRATPLPDRRKRPAGTPPPAPAPRAKRHCVRTLPPPIVAVPTPSATPTPTPTTAYQSIRTNAGTDTTVRATATAADTDTVRRPSIEPRAGAAQTDAGTETRTVGAQDNVQ